ncbi:MAG TPA: hypothetical protein VFH73_24755 [Polyangia bacterium]|jgi:hypothetical protein|nr:hypothetical protein [Polyangia bacterium]
MIGRRARGAAVLLPLLLCLPGAAQARSLATVSYAAVDVWPAAIRFLRVDRDYGIKEKDEAAGYVLFEAIENKRPYRAALELVKTTDGEGRAATQLIVTVADLPRHFELSLLDKLAAKLRDERGPPGPPPPRRAPAPPAADGSAPKPPASAGELPRPPVWGPGAGAGDATRPR